MVQNMTFRRRLTVLAALAVAALATYSTARYFSRYLVQYVVGQMLVQKAPAGTDPTVLQRRLVDSLSALPNGDAKLEKLLNLSWNLEKVQSLTPGELDGLLK